MTGLAVAVLQNILVHQLTQHNILAHQPLIIVFLARRVYDRTPTKRQQRSHNRWLVAYTLIRNPQLQNLTAKNIAKSKMATLSCEEDQVDVMGRSGGPVLTFETYPPLPKPV